MTSFPIILLLLSALQIVFLFFLQENDLPKALIPFIGVSILFCTVTTVLAVMLKRSNGNKDKLLAEMQASLSSRREAEQDGAIFEDNLRSAGLITRLQQPRLNVQQQNQSTAPERYRYIQSMVEMGLDAQKIAATLSMSLHETTQIITLIKMANPQRQDDTSPLPSPEAKDAGHTQHDWSRCPAATKQENHSVPECANDFCINHHQTTKLTVKKHVSLHIPASDQSGVLHKSRKLARWLRIRAFPSRLRSQGSREPPRRPLPRTSNLLVVPLSGYI